MALQAVWYAPNTPTLVGDLGVEHPKTQAALRALGEEAAGRVEAVLVISPHFVTGGALGLVAGPQLKQIYDFWGFPPGFYRLRYPAPAAPEAAARLLEMAGRERLALEAVNGWGLDHGAWAPLRHLFPAADVPVLPLSIAPDQGAPAHEQLGALIRRLAATMDVALLATGSLIHRLDLWNARDSRLPERAQAYLDGVLAAWRAGSWQAIWDLPATWRREADPEGQELPLRVLAGAVPRFTAEVVADEREFEAVSLTTVRFREEV